MVVKGPPEVTDVAVTVSRVLEAQGVSTEDAMKAMMLLVASSLVEHATTRARLNRNIARVNTVMAKCCYQLWDAAGKPK
jgi:hypothetical protein